MCCGKAKSRDVTIPKNSTYLDNFSFLTTQQLAKKGVYVYCYKCSLYHTQEENVKCKTEGGAEENK
jgi:hypothetical protein